MITIDLSLWRFALIAVTALGAQLIGGLSGYGTGLLMPIVLAPLIGPEAVVPVISLSSILTNATRVAVFRDSLDLRKALLISAFALPSTVLGAYFLTWLSSRGAAFVLGAGSSSGPVVRLPVASSTASSSAARPAPALFCSRCSWRWGLPARRSSRRTP